MDQDKTSKAVWDTEASKIFCECAVEQVVLGNRPTKFLTATGYKNLEADFNSKTGGNYDRKKLKNRWDNLKTIYSEWVFYKNTRLGWDEEKQTIIADDHQWAELIKIHKLIRGFRKGPPDNLDMLAIMFESANIDGNSSVMPGVEEVVAIQIDEDDVVDVEIETPTRSKRATSAIPSSPSKSKKSNVPKEFKRFVDHVISEDRSAQSSTATEGNEIAAIMEDVAKCGASEMSDEYYIATKLFAKPSNHNFFYAMKTSEGRLNWLKRQFEDRKRN